jgi:Invasion associated locus B (IalB) protein
MTSPIHRLAGALALSLAFTGAVAGAAAAQVSQNRVAASTDWSVFVEGSPQECWGVSAPKETVNSKDGKPVAARRGDILLFITFRPGAKGEISFTGGYPFAPGSTVGLDVSGTTFDLFSDGEWAWAGSPEDDEKIITAMKAGSTAILTARSARGTETRDTFSLSGFSAAMDEAAKRCAG